MYFNVFHLLVSCAFCCCCWILLFIFYFFLSFCLSSILRHCGWNVLQQPLLHHMHLLSSFGLIRKRRIVCSHFRKLHFTFVVCVCVCLAFELQNESTSVMKIDTHTQCVLCMYITLGLCVWLCLQ